MLSVASSDYLTYQLAEPLTMSIRYGPGLTFAEPRFNICMIYANYYRF